tara:strand:+ start:4180 stop:5037 length:858 start_codon:yes stop_codon:yes gene_type:complete
MPIQYTGFADEAEKSLADQIAVLKEVGWSAIELRLIDGKNVCDQSDAQWRETWELLQQEKISVVGFGGQIGNWARSVDSDFQIDEDELVRVAPRMRESGCKFLRVMSYPNSEVAPLDAADWRHETVRRIRELAEIAEGEGVILGHENCSGYGGTKEGFLELVEEVDHPAFKLIFDTGNNTLHEKSGEATWEYYDACRSEIVHVHIKAAIPAEGGDYETCFVDEDPIQARILTDLQANNYEGWLSIEPHLAAAIHAGQDIDDSGRARQVWVEYAERLEQLVEKTAS